MLVEDAKPSIRRHATASNVKQQGEQPHHTCGRLSVSATTRERVRELVTEALKNGDSLRTLKNALRQADIFSAGRAETIARTETSTAMGRASVQAYTSNGYEGKEWRTSGFDVDNGDAFGP